MVFLLQSLILLEELLEFLGIEVVPADFVGQLGNVVLREDLVLGKVAEIFVLLEHLQVVEVALRQGGLVVDGSVGLLEVSLIRILVRGGRSRLEVVVFLVLVHIYRGLNLNPRISL